LRLARGFTGRDKIVKFIGCYHGHHDSLLVKAGSGAATFGVPDSPGVPAEIAKTTISVPYNNIEAVKEVIEKDGQDIAAIIIEPVAGNMGLVLPKADFLQELRKITQENGILLIFDEVMCGFRVALGGAQAKYNVKPDLTCLGKVIGGGLPVGAYGGRRDIMKMISPSGPVYQAGTLSGNPLAMAAGIATLDIIVQANYTQQIVEKTARLVEALQEQAEKVGVTVQMQQAGSMFGFFFTSDVVVDYDSATKSDLTAFNLFFQTMLEEGIYTAPSQFETLFMSGAHSDEDVEKTVKASAVAFAKVADYLKSK
jgi:Glutamate-1-semialdehyde aminotransferase